MSTYASEVYGQWDRVDHTPIKKLIEAMGGFKVRKRTWSAIQGLERLRMLNKGQFDFWVRRDRPEVRVQEGSAFLNELSLFRYKMRRLNSRPRHTI